MPQFTLVYIQIGRLLYFPDIQQTWANLRTLQIGNLDTMPKKELWTILSLYINFWKGIFYVGILLSIAYNSMIFIDLWLSLRNPFYPRRKRRKYYNLATITLLIYVFIILITNERKLGTTLNLYDFKNDDESFVLGYQGFFIFLIVLVWLPMIRIMMILCRKGTSKDLRHKVFKYQVIYFLLYILTIFSMSYDLWNFIPK